MNPKFLKENTEIKQLARGWTKDWGFRGLQEEAEGIKGKPQKRNTRRMKVRKLKMGN